jgi:hypothetical protein
MAYLRKKGLGDAWEEFFVGIGEGIYLSHFRLIHQGPREITQNRKASIAPLQVFFFKIVVFANACCGFEIGQ